MTGPVLGKLSEMLEALSHPALVGSDLKAIIAQPDETVAKILIAALEAGVGTRMIAKGADVSEAAAAAGHVADRVVQAWKTLHARRE